MRVLRRGLSRLFWPDATAYRHARTVVCHDWFAVPGGSDKVAARIVEVMRPDVVYTFARSPACLEALEISVPVVSWRGGAWAGRNGRVELLLPVMPIVWWALDLEEAATVVTSSHSCVNAISTPHAWRASYCHTPMRYAWNWRLEQARMPLLGRPLLPVGAWVFRWLDRRWARKVDRFLANSSFVAERIHRSYGTDATVVHPPIDIGRFSAPNVRPAGPDAPFLAAGRLVQDERFDLAIEAANIAEVPLVVAGDGPDLARLRQLAGPTVDFEVAPDDRRLLELFRTSRALVFPGVEDFGTLPVEAQSCGLPVLALGNGGALDSVVANVTGAFVESSEPAMWADAMASFDADGFSREQIMAHADRFSEAVFDAALKREVVLRLPGSAPIDGSAITVLIPAHNEEAVIGGAIESVLAQSIEDVDVLVVDDRCTDRTVEFAESYPNVRVISNLGAGLADALNTGLGESRPIVVRLDADDRHRPGLIAAVTAPLFERDEVVLVGGAALERTAAGVPIASRYAPPDRRHAAFSMAADCPYLHSAVAYRSERVLAVGGYDRVRRYGIDYDLWVRLHATGDEMVGVPAMLAERVVMPGSVSAANWKTQAAARHDAAHRATAAWRAQGGSPRRAVQLGRELRGGPRRQHQAFCVRYARDRMRERRYGEAGAYAFAAAVLGPIGVIRAVAEMIHRGRHHRDLWNVKRLRSR